MIIDKINVDLKKEIPTSVYSTLLILWQVLPTRPTNNKSTFSQIDIEIKF